jgi:peptide/nickel transport system permease protein
MIIVAIALSVNFLGDGLRDAFDPRHTGKKRRRRAGLFALPTRKEKP